MTITEIQRETLKVLGDLVRLVGEDRDRTTELETKIDGIRNDLALVRGGHARNVMAQNLPRIADRFAFEFISELPQQAIIAMSKFTTGQGDTQGNAESFSNADMVISVRDDQGKPAYVAMEASFTVDDNDVQRAIRNAGYLHEYTGLPAYPAVVGVHVLDSAQAEVDAKRVLLYQIPAGELQPD